VLLSREVAAEATGICHAESGSRSDNLRSTVRIRDLVDEPAGATGEHVTVAHSAKQEPLQAR
jgi:hypothetical protein